MRHPLDRNEDRYRHDVHFRTMVDALQAVILNLDMTPSEVREAAVYACIRVAEQYPTVFRHPIDPSVAKVLDEIAAMAPSTREEVLRDMRRRDTLPAPPDEEQLEVQECTRPPPHACRVNGPCNGLPKEST